MDRVKAVNRFSEMAFSLRCAGYEDHFEQIDARMVAQSNACVVCGNPHLVYCGFKSGGSYRAFAVCRKCDYYEEF